MSATEWMTRGKCRDYEPDMFHPESGGRYIYSSAIAVCNSPCPVKMQCLGYALDNMTDRDDDMASRAIGRYGVWGGTTPDERKAIHARTQLVAA